MSKQAHRGLSIYICCCAVVVLILSQLSSHGPAAKPADLVKRTFQHYQSTLAEGAFPRKIWQSWKVDPLDFEERDLICARSWVSKNPGYRYEVLTDSNDMQYVETHFGPNGLDRPNIVYVYQSLTAKIIKADLLRYLVMYIEGGLYVDIDVEALKPIDRFIPDTSRFHEQDIDMIIGVEVDQPQFADHPILGPKSMSFCQWTFMCKPRLPVMLHLVENIVNWLYDLSEQQNVPISEISFNFDDVISGTGPSAFTQAILAEMSQREKKEVTWDYFHQMDESRLVGGVLVLTVEAFAAGQGHSDSGTHDSRNALVKHHYHASGWPTLHPRYKHPVYGEVEACNWDPDCVKLWDFSKAAFDALPPEEQARQIAEREAADLALMTDQQFGPPPMQLPIELPDQLDLNVPVLPPAPVPVELPNPLDVAVEPPPQPDAHIDPPEPVIEPARLEARHLQGPPPEPLINTVSVPSFSVKPTVSHHGWWKPTNTVASVVSSLTVSQHWWKPKPTNTVASVSVKATVSQQALPQPNTVASSASRPTVSQPGSWKPTHTVASSVSSPTVSHQPWWKPKPSNTVTGVSSRPTVAPKPQHTDTVVKSVRAPSPTVSQRPWWKPETTNTVHSVASSPTVAHPDTVVKPAPSATVSQRPWWKPKSTNTVNSVAPSSPTVLSHPGAPKPAHTNTVASHPAPVNTISNSNSVVPTVSHHWWRGPKPTNTAASISIPVPVKPTVSHPQHIKPSLTVASQLSPHLTVTPSNSPWKHPKSLLSGFATVYSKPSAIPGKGHGHSG